MESKIYAEEIPDKWYAGKLLPYVDTVKNAAERLGVSPSTIYRRIKGMQGYIYFSNGTSSGRCCIYRRYLI